MKYISYFFILLTLECLKLISVENVSANSGARIDDNLGNFDENPVAEIGEEDFDEVFPYYSVVKPHIYHGRQKRSINKKNFSYHPSQITVLLPTNKGELTLDLTLNKELLPKQYFRQIQKNGTNIVQKPVPKEIDSCHYKGKVGNKYNSWVALSTCDGLSGVIYDGNQMHYIEKKYNGENNEHYLYSNLVNGYKYGFTEEKKQKFRNKRSSAENKIIRRPWNANFESRYVELVLVVSNGKYKAMNENLKEVENYCRNIANIMNGLYSPLNIFIALVGVVVWVEHDEIEISDNGDKTLTKFLAYRREKLVKEHPNDHAQLLINTGFTNKTVGKALKQSICTFQYSGGITGGHSSVVSLVATTAAHTLGHNLGMEYDSEDCECPDKVCIMNRKYALLLPTQWSSCSRNAVQHAFKHGMDHCLRNKPVPLFQGPVCGNGFLEEGEECDCGLPKYCNNTCCNPSTCTLHINASCATGECCDLKTCSFKKPGNTCRNANNECDLSEYCIGDTEFCPPDVYKMDTEICNNGNGYCYQGHCGTHSDQCSLLWGSSAEQANQECYKLNVKGTRHGHCRYEKFNHSYNGCDKEDVLCGLLHCNHKQTDLQYGLEAASILSTGFIDNNGTFLHCRSANVDLGLNDPDPGMVPNGAKCGERKMCLNQKCMSVATLQKGHTCPYHCYNNGWCNNLGHCHCNPGYLLPFCQHYLSSGGSVDSGPPGPLM